MAASSARRNRIMALTLDNTKLKNKVDKNTDEISQKPLDFKNFPVIFDFKNEYKNSREWVQANDLLELKSSFTFESNLVKNTTQDLNFLLCNERMEISPQVEENCERESDVDVFHDSDDDQDKTYVPESSDSDEDVIITQKNRRSSTHNLTIQSSSFISTSPRIPSTSPTIITSYAIIENIQDTTNINLRDEMPEIENNTDKGLTKDGKPRKRRKFNESLNDRVIKKNQTWVTRNALKNPCSENCSKKCLTKFTAQERQDIHDRYVALDYEGQGFFIKCLVDEKPIIRRTKVADVYKRNTTFIYYLKGFDNSKKEVCKKYFLSTLGYNHNNDRRIVTAMKKAIDEQKTKRGAYQRTVIDRQILKDHIMSYGPAISHYRREHAPKKLYLPSDITITMMHENFCSSRPDIKVSLEVYRKVLRKDLNISFAHLGNEECEQCELYKRHDSSHILCPEDTCEICNNFNLHHKPRYTETRKEYQNDLVKAKNETEVVYYSVDLQKIIMLPRMDQFKSAIFCPRLIAFNESFVPLGPATTENMPFAVIWNESIAGRNQDDIISAFKAFFDHKRDLKHIVLWLDNCSAQNKNWSLLCFLVDIVNSSEISAKSITLKFFEPGHTFMSADSFHHQVELSLQQKMKVYDFDDFVDSVQRSNKRKNVVKVMGVADFILYEDKSSQHKLRKNEPRVYLSKIMAVRVERGLYKLKYKLSHDQEQYSPEPLDFLQLKIVKTEQFPPMQRKVTPRGITQERKAAIIDKLVPLMPENRKAFWTNLPTTESAGDLLEEN